MLFLRLVLAVACILCVDFAHAKEAVVVELCVPDDPPELLEEASYRMRAELQAVGFVVERGRANSTRGGADGSLKKEGSAEEGFDGSKKKPNPGRWRLELISSERILKIRAYSDSSASPLTQEIVWKQVSSAEVIAIRAVELLRAAMLQTLRDGNLQSVSSESLRDFTNYQDEKGESSTTSKGKEETRARQGGSGNSVNHSEGRSVAGPIRWMFALAPALHGEGAGSGLSVAAEAQATLMIHSFFAGMSLDGGLVPSTWELDEGDVRLRHFSVLWRSGWVAPCPGVWECQLGVAGGFHEIYMSPESLEGSEALSSRHASLLMQADTLLGYFLESGIGVFMHFRLGAMLDAPRAQEEETNSVLGRPSFSLALGAAFRTKE